MPWCVRASAEGILTTAASVDTKGLEAVVGKIRFFRIQLSTQRRYAGAYAQLIASGVSYHRCP